MPVRTGPPSGPAVTATSAAWGIALRRLVAAGDVEADDVARGAVEIVHLARSHAVGALCVDGVPIAVLKQHRHDRPDADPFDTEQQALRCLRGGPVPDLLHAWPDLRTLVVEHVDGRVLHEHLEARASDVDLHGLGVALARAHRACGGSGVDPGPFAVARPWALDLAAGRLPAHLDTDPDAQELAGRIAGDAALVAAIRRVSDRWRPATLVHGDVKFDNAIVRDDGDVVLIDWELAAPGPAEWDLAGVADGLVVPAVRAAMADPLTRVHRVGAALDGYRAAGGATIDEPLLEAATVTRLAQSALQLVAMRQLDPDGADEAHRVLDVASTLAALLERGSCAA